MPVEQNPIRACGHDDVAAAVALLDAIWAAPAGCGPINAPMLHTLIHTGACVRLAAAHGSAPLGAAIAFASTSDARLLHLHVVGVAPDARGAGLGERLMRDVAHWAGGRDFEAIEWTFDPLVARNAHLYLTMLGARPSRYLIDQYGAIDDGINRGQGSDRLLVRWDLGRDVWKPEAIDEVVPIVSVGPDGGPLVNVEAFGSRGAVGIPSDIERLRIDAPAIACTWRAVTSQIFADPRAAIAGFDRRVGYLIDRTDNGGTS